MHIPPIALRLQVLEGEIAFFWIEGDRADVGPAKACLLTPDRRGKTLHTMEVATNGRQSAARSVRTSARGAFLDWHDHIVRHLDRYLILTEED